MNVSPVASSTKVQSALSNLGIPEGFIANDVVPLLQQLVVALGNVTSGGGGSASLDVGSTVVDGGTTGYVLYDNSGILGELGTSIGGNESTDAGKLVKFGPTGNLVGSLVQALNPASSPVVTTKLNYNEVLFTTGVSASASLRSAGGSSVYNLPNIASGTYNVITSGDTGSVTDTMLAGSISNSKLSNSAITIAGTSTSLGGSISQDTITGLSSTGLVKRTAANTLSIASAGTDYVSPSGTLALGGFGSITGTLGASNGGTGITSLGTGVATALGVNVGSAGAFITFNGAAGTPSSLALTNATGLPLTTGVTGTLAVANGGTGITAFGTGVATALGNAVNATSGLLTYSIIGTSGATLGLLNTANTFSAAQVINNSATLLFDVQNSGTSRFKVSTAGVVTLGGAGTNSSIVFTGSGTSSSISSNAYGDGLTSTGFFAAPGFQSSSGGAITFRANGNLNLGSGTVLGFSSSSDGAGTIDTKLVRAAAASFQMGADHATTATDQTLSAHNVTTGTGASLTIRNGKGSTAGGAVVVACSATNGAPVTLATFKANGNINFSNLPTSSAGLASGDLYKSAGVLMVA